MNDFCTAEDAADCGTHGALGGGGGGQLHQHSNDEGAVSVFQQSLSFFRRFKLSFRELKYGTPVFDANGNKLGYSRIAAQYGISQVILSRMAMALPGMGKCKSPG